MKNLSPMMNQYFKIKDKHKDHIVFFRLGDFYEMFFEDAILASKELELTLTGRDCGLSERAPMCGVPFHSSEGYIARLIAKGYKVAVCEQITQPEKGKMVERDVVRVITPGTVIEGSMLEEDKNNYIACIYFNKSNLGICFADISTGKVEISYHKGSNPTSKIIDDLSRYMPSEIIFNDKLLSNKTLTEFIKKNLNCAVEVYSDKEIDIASISEDIRKIAVENKFTGESAKHDSMLTVIGKLLEYLKQNKIEMLGKTLKINEFEQNNFMVLDSNARRNLELTSTMRTGEKRGSLLWVLDKTKTSMGKRLIRSYIDRPLCNAVKIDHRLSAVEELYGKPSLIEEISAMLVGIFDIERLISKISYGTASPREIVSLGFTAQRIPEIKRLISDLKSTEMRDIHDSMDTLADVTAIITSSLNDTPPISIIDGDVIKDGYNFELDQLRDLLGNGKQYLADIEAREREATGIKNLKIGYNRVFGYFLEVLKSNTDLVPDTYIRKQTLTNAERYITQELKELEDKVLGAKDQIFRLETTLFNEIRSSIGENTGRIMQTAQAIARLDVMNSFANVAIKNNYTRPMLTSDGSISIKDGRHPVVELMSNGSLFVPNDTVLDTKLNSIALITGPNMAGKSTYMRQVALITIMTQIGCFVPAKSANISIVDKVFTRVGASDDLTSGQSTFMVEMVELADILKYATKNSLVLLDEIGRGTSTFDGMSIAKAALEYIGDKKLVGCKTLFATHYHELISCENEIDGLKNYNISAKKRGDDIIFLRRIVPGGADDSYGIEVAKLAGVPAKVVDRAKEVLTELESGKINTTVIKKETPFGAQLTLGENHPVIDKLTEIDVDTLTPLEALSILYEMKKELK